MKKKVFISVPLKGRSKKEIEDSIEKIKGATEELLGKDLEFVHGELKDIPDFNNNKEDVKDSLLYLSKEVELMADADYLATISEGWDYRRCSIEKDIFRRYKAKNWPEERDIVLEFSLNIICPDLIKKEREKAKKLWGKDSLVAEEGKAD